MTDEADGYRATLKHRWASGRRRPGRLLLVGVDQRDHGAPADASPEFLTGWRKSVDATTAW